MNLNLGNIMHIEVVRSEGDLTRYVWSFWFCERNMTLYLDHFKEEYRETLRHKFRAITAYDRIDARSNSIQMEQISLPPSVMDEAKQKFVDQIVVKKWDK